MVNYNGKMYLFKMYIFTLSFRNDIMTILREVDPHGVEVRRTGKLTRRTYSSQGPNFIVHIDGYDKLKPFGFAIHGAICGCVLSKQRKLYFSCFHVRFITTCHFI